MLKSTALPLMKKFGIDGEGFDLKVRTQRRPVHEHGEKLQMQCCNVTVAPSRVSSVAAPSGGEEGHGARRGRRSVFLLSGPQDHQACAADRPGEDQEDQRSGVSFFIL